MTILSRSATLGALAALFLCGTATAIPAAAQGWQGGGRQGGGWDRSGQGAATIAGDWGRGGQAAAGIAGDWGRGGQVAGGMTGGPAPGAPGGSVYALRYYTGCYWQTRPIYDSWGNFAGYQPIQVCY